MILDAEPIGLSAVERSLLAKRIGEFDEVLAVSPARLRLEAVEFSASVRTGRPATSIEAGALSFLSHRDMASLNELGQALGFPEEGSELPRLVFERLCAAGLVKGDQSAVYLTQDGRESAGSERIFEATTNKYTVVLPPPAVAAGKPALLDRAFALNLGKRIDWSSDVASEQPNLDILLDAAHVQHPDIHSPDLGVKIDEQSLVMLRRGRVDIEVRCALVRSRSDKVCRLVPASDEKKPDRLKVLSALAAGAGAEMNRILAEHASRQASSATSHVEAPVVDPELDTLVELIEGAERSGDYERGAHFKTMFQSLRLARFGTLDFEDELMKVFARAGAIWIASPFVRDRAFGARAAQIENALRRKATIVLVSSLPEGDSRPNVDTAARRRLEKLNEHERRFLFVELPSFHYKRLFAFGAEDCQYEGSFNILSFKGEAERGTVREESMVKLPWNEEAAIQFAELRAGILQTLVEQHEQARARLEDHKADKSRAADRSLSDHVARLAGKIEMVRGFSLPNKKGSA